MDGPLYLAILSMETRNAKTVSTFLKMLSSASLSFKLYSELSIGSYNCILHHADQSLKDKFLPKIVEGKWSICVSRVSMWY